MAENNEKNTNTKANTSAAENNISKGGFLKNLFGGKKDTDNSYSYSYSQTNPHKSKRTVRLVGDESNFAMREAYKTGRTNIVFALPDEKCNVLLITSSWPMEGKTTNCANLAVAFAQTGAKTLLIDGDLRKPRIHKIFKIQSKLGLTNILRNFCTIEEGTNHSTYDNLDIITSGHIPPNPAELLGSDEMKELLGKLKDIYEYIIIDSPPVNMVSDAIVLSSIASGTALVVRQGVTDHKSVTESLEKINFAGAKFLGFILNDTSDPHGNYYNGSKKYRYKYSRKYYYSSYYEYGRNSSRNSQTPKA